MKKLVVILEHIFRLPSYLMVIVLFIVFSINTVINSIIFSFKYSNPIKKIKGDIGFFIKEFF